MEFMEHELLRLHIPIFHTVAVVTGWKILGTLGAVIFAARWFVQLIYSRRARKSVTPTAFWIMSLIGSSLMLIYFIFSPKQDMVGVINNLFPGFVSIYNIYLELKLKNATGRPKAQATALPAALVPEAAAE